jgi:hypothetical protein
MLFLVSVAAASDRMVRTVIVIGADQSQWYHAQLFDSVAHFL